ncbi:hypothetical protein F4810DRAFT_720344 [Camillea tinctor]|nr:hypothetical protein F4810DRAFT_720344 [Camillea tinctor]
MSLSLRNDTLRWTIHERIISLDQLQRFAFYHFDLLKSGSRDARRQYLRIQTFYVDLLEKPLESLRESMSEIDLESLRRYAFEDPIMGDPFISPPNSSPTTPESTSEAHSPGNSHAGVEEVTEIEATGVEEENTNEQEDSDIKQQSPIKKMMTYFIPFSGFANAGSSSTSVSNSNDALEDTGSSKTEILSRQEHMIFSQAQIQSPEETLSWADEVEEAIREEEEENIASSSSIEHAPRHHRSASSSSSVDGGPPEAVANLREEIAHMTDPHPSVSHGGGDNNEGNLRDYNLEETALQWNSLFDEKTWFQEAIMEAVGDGRDEDDLLDQWDETTGMWWWQREGMYLIALVERGYARQFHEAREAYVAHPWDKVDGTAAYQERAAMKRREMALTERKGSLLRDCATIRY